MLCNFKKKNVASAFTAFTQNENTGHFSTGPMLNAKKDLSGKILWEPYDVKLFHRSGDLSSVPLSAKQ